MLFTPVLGPILTFCVILLLFIHRHMFNAQILQHPTKRSVVCHLHQQNAFPAVFSTLLCILPHPFVSLSFEFFGDQLAALKEQIDKALESMAAIGLKQRELQRLQLKNNNILSGQGTPQLVGLLTGKPFGSAGLPALVSFFSLSLVVLPLFAGFPPHSSSPHLLALYHTDLRAFCHTDLLALCHTALFRSVTLPLSLFDAFFLLILLPLICSPCVTGQGAAPAYDITRRYV